MSDTIKVIIKAVQQKFDSIYDEINRCGKPHAAGNLRDYKTYGNYHSYKVVLDDARSYRTICKCVAGEVIWRVNAKDTGVIDLRAISREEFIDLVI